MVNLIHVCEGCGAVYEMLGAYWACQDSHPGLAVPPADIYLGEDRAGPQTSASSQKRPVRKGS